MYGRTNSVLGSDSSPFDATFVESRSGTGTVFKVNPTTGAETVLYIFAGGPTQPAAELFYYDGHFYGTTSFGGEGTGGTIFRVNP
jgi:uncharacterized repeat protein (TIGR03803 family)